MHFQMAGQDVHLISTKMCNVIIMSHLMGFGIKRVQFLTIFKTTKTESKNQKRREKAKNKVKNIFLSVKWKNGEKLKDSQTQKNRLEKM